MNLRIRYIGIVAGFCTATLWAQTPVTIYPDSVYQTIVGFSASDCWTCNYVGVWDNAAKDHAAEKLFSTSLDSKGNPKGIGLSMWRINLGGGTAEMGDSCGIGDISRRAECFLNADGTYDWTKQAGQRFFWTKAKEYGCDNFVLFSNTPPVYYTRNGLGFSPGDWKSNLKEDCYDKFADFLVTCAEHLSAEEGLNVTHISPVNEPQYQWNSGQEGTPWTNEELKKLVVEMDRRLQVSDLDTKILITEAGSWSALLGRTSFAENQIYNFFDSSSPNYVGNLPSMAKVVGGHSYWTDTKNADMRSIRRQVGDRCRGYGIDCFQTEWSLLSGPPIDDFPASFDDASYMDIAIHMAKVIHTDLTEANVTSWSYWTSMDMERWGHKNRFSLLKVVPAGGDYDDIKNPGSVTAHKTLWALGNYSLFIRPGYKRIKLEGADDMSGILGSAYLSPDSTKLVAVYINVGKETEQISTDIKVWDGYEVKSRTTYRTSSLIDLMRVANQVSYTDGELFSIPYRSVITMIYDIAPVHSAIESESAPRIVCRPNPIEKGESLNIRLGGIGQFDCAELYTLDGKLLYREVIPGEVREVSLPVNTDDKCCLFRLKGKGKCYSGKVFIR